jgi:Spy/CpxP family protein refolding chaperone
MKCKWVKLVLAASLAMNLAFAGPYIYNKLIRKPTRQPERKHTKSYLNLGKEQKEQFRAIFKDFKVQMMQYKQDILEKRIDIIDELGDPDFEPQTITQLTNELNQLENQLNLLFVDSLIRTNALLAPEQRLKFLYRVSRDWFFLDKGRPFRQKDRRGGGGGRDTGKSSQRRDT